MRNKANCRLFFFKSLILNVSPANPGKALPASIMGCATPDPAFPFAVTIYYGRIHDLARTWTGTEDEILGPVIAHEMGHLFLGFSGHSSSGVMSGRWDSSLFKLAQVEQLRFSRQQVAAIQANVARRLQAATAQLTVQGQVQQPEANSAKTSVPITP